MRSVYSFSFVSHNMSFTVQSLSSSLVDHIQHDDLAITGPCSTEFVIVFHLFFRFLQESAVYLGQIFLDSYPSSLQLPSPFKDQLSGAIGGDLHYDGPRRGLFLGTCCRASKSSNTVRSINLMSLKLDVQFV